MTADGATLAPTSASEKERAKRKNTGRVLESRGPSRRGTTENVKLTRNIMKISHSLIAAAVGGILFGATGCGGETPPAQAPAAASSGSAADTAAAPGSATPQSAAAPAKHACKGQNECKGQGSCKTDKHGCKGQNDCKGQGGCKSA
jgi:hypothetical protein